MKQVITIVMVLCLGLSLQAQQLMPVVLVNANGKICYQSPGQKKKQEVITGAVLKRNGRVELPANASVTMYCDGNFVKKSGKQSFTLLEAFPEGAKIKLDFDHDFGNYSMAAIMMVGGSNDKRDGWGTIDDPKKIRFYWSKPAGNEDYHFEIRDKANQLLMEKTLKDTFLVVDLKGAAFKTGVKYDWWVTTTGSQAIRSNTLSFELGTATERDEAIKMAEDGSLYKESPEELKRVMEAVSLELDGWFEEASRKYDTVQKMHPNNEYVKLMHAAFWMRCGLQPKARAVYK
ncbi:MAG: hypothetical protein IPL65_08740 [Lewinellaceae bacterium]|nr:hypothetical protein [Lewinellaceae bacterium]